MKPNMGYDRAITIFSPDGRLFQVEYAMKAVERGSTSIAVKFSDGVILLGDRIIPSPLVERDSVEKVFIIDDHVAAVVSGWIADGRALVERARLIAQHNRWRYGEPIDIDVLVREICDHIQAFTQYGGARPYGVSLLIGGVDSSGPHLYETDPSGNYIGFKASALGIGRNSAFSVLESEYRDNISEDEALRIAVKALYVANEGKVDPRNIEVAIVKKGEKARKLTEEERVEILGGILDGLR
ncbi:MAG TPA: archaeal proteasome endopeptidase complex subunit alpha [Thermoprotei archaeon]|nr:archaeal proteasome endopeptidase complex subunit alpha [Euryarchaeota archaeon]MCD6158191.1 archaeal proteasome endopeptidase complex subunit alpha [Euryarchaeota archaeon]HDJ51197.1 archaeal proteasome endopeptidase complex subunit alpha [Thermoprotei archaeon]